MKLFKIVVVVALFWAEFGASRFIEQKSIYTIDSPSQDIPSQDIPNICYLLQDGDDSDLSRQCENYLFPEPMPRQIIPGKTSHKGYKQLPKNTEPRQLDLDDDLDLDQDRYQRTEPRTEPRPEQQTEEDIVNAIDPDSGKPHGLHLLRGS